MLCWRIVFNLELVYNILFQKKENTKGCLLVYRYKITAGSRWVLKGKSPYSLPSASISLPVHQQGAVNVSAYSSWKKKCYIRTIIS